MHAQTVDTRPFSPIRVGLGTRLAPAMITITLVRKVSDWSKQTSKQANKQASIHMHNVVILACESLRLAQIYTQVMR